MTDPAENKTKFSVGFREVQESFYDLVGKEGLLLIENNDSLKIMTH